MQERGAQIIKKFDRPEEGRYENKSMEYIQNRTNWCWIVACKIVGEQYKRNFTEVSFQPGYGGKEAAVSNLNGLRMDVVRFTPLPWGDMTRRRAFCTAIARRLRLCLRKMDF